MPLHCLPCLSCGSGAMLMAALALLAVPPRLFFPEAFFSSQTLDHVANLNKLDVASPKLEHIDDLLKLNVASPKNTFADYFHQQSVDLFPSMIVLTIGILVYLSEWINRKLMEIRILKMNAFLSASLERLRETDARRQQLEGTLRLARGAAAEYNLLLYLLLRKRKEEPEWRQEHVV